MKAIMAAFGKCTILMLVIMKSIARTSTSKGGIFSLRDCDVLDD